jgi:hypothetical protein
MELSPSLAAVKNEPNLPPKLMGLCGCGQPGRTYNTGNGSESRSSGPATEKGSYRI